MKPKTLILMVVAVVCGLGASYMTSRLLAEREEPAPQQQVEKPKVKLLVAKKKFEQGLLIKNTADVFEEKLVLQEYAPKEALTDPLALKGKTLKRSMRPGDHITADDIQDGTPGLKPPQGYLAVGIRVTLESSASGWASLPNTRVDLLWNLRHSDPGKSFSRTLLKNVLVLAADVNQHQTPDGSAMPAQVVTVALTPADSRKVTLASEHGTLRLVVRQPGEDVDLNKKDASTEIVRLQELVGDPKDDHKTKGTPPPAVTQAQVPEVVDPPNAEGPQPKPRRQHIVWFRHGPKQWKEVVYLDEKGNVVSEEVEQVESSAPPAVQQAPAAPPAAAQQTPAPKKKN